MMRVIKLKFFFANLVIVSIVTIYMGFVPISIETQPVFLLLFIFILAFFTYRNKYSVDYVQLWTMLFVIILVLTTVVSFVELGVVSIVSGMKYIVGPLIFICAYRMFPLVRLPALLSVMFVFSLYVILSFSFGEKVVRSILFLPMRMVHDRLSILTPEPSYFAMYFSFFVSLILYLKVKYIVAGQYKRQYKYALIISLLLIILFAVLTGSAYAYLLVLVLLMCATYVRYKKRFIKAILFLLLVASSSFYVIVNGPESRLKHVTLVLSGAISGKVSLEDVLYGAGTSGSTRLILNYIGLSTPFVDNWWGVGVGGFSSNWVSVASDLKIPIYKHEILRSESPLLAQTYLFNITSDIGIFSLLLLPLFFVGNYKNVSQNKDIELILLFIRVSLIFFFLFQSQITNPIPWLLLVMLKKPAWNFSSYGARASNEKRCPPVLLGDSTKFNNNFGDFIT